MLAMAAEVTCSQVKEDKLVWRQDLTFDQLRSIDKEELDSPWNDQFKAYAHEYTPKRLRQADGEKELKPLKGSCPISFAQDTRTNIYFLTYGYMQGLYASEYYPRDGC